MPLVVQATPNVFGPKAERGAQPEGVKSLRRGLASPLTSGRRSRNAQLFVHSLLAPRAPRGYKITTCISLYQADFRRMPRKSTEYDWSDRGWLGGIQKRSETRCLSPCAGHHKPQRMRAKVRIS